MYHPQSTAAAIKRRRSNTALIIGLIVGIICIVIYARKQLSMENPVLNLKAFAIGGFRTGTVLVMLSFGITLSAMFLMPQFIQRGLELPVAMTGIVLLPGGLMNAVFSLIAGKLYDKIGPKLIVKIGFLLAAAATVLLLFTSTSSPVWYVILCHMLLLTGVPMAMAPSQTNGLASLPHELSTDGSAILNTMQQVWGAVCTAIATSLLGIGMTAYAGDDPAASFTNGFHYGIAFTLVLAIAGFAISFAVKKVTEDR